MHGVGGKGHPSFKALLNQAWFPAHRLIVKPRPCSIPHHHYLCTSWQRVAKWANHCLQYITFQSQVYSPLQFGKCWGYWALFSGADSTDSEATAALCRILFSVSVTRIHSTFHIVSYNLSYHWRRNPNPICASGYRQQTPLRCTDVACVHPRNVSRIVMFDKLPISCKI